MISGNKKPPQIPYGGLKPISNKNPMKNGEGDATKTDRLEYADDAILYMGKRTYRTYKYNCDAIN